MFVCVLNIYANIKLNLVIYLVSNEEFKQLVIEGMFNRHLRDVVSN